MAKSVEEFESTITPQKSQRQRTVQLHPALTILAHPDPARIGDYVTLTGITRGKPAGISRMQPQFKRPGRVIGKPLADPFISREPFFLSPDGNGNLLLRAPKGKSSFWVDDEELTGDRVIEAERLTLGSVLVLGERIVLLLHTIERDIEHKGPDYGLVGHSDRVIFLRQEIGRVTDLATPVLLRGASGTGKELVARAIHETGRRGKSFISVNMAAIPPSLAASELFGAVKGSFTGASRHQTGYFKAAQGGTLFLDEIGETNIEVQVMLLRALETGEISPVGAQSSFRVETRLIAATDADLESKMAEDSFKTPLFHRLAGYEINLPRLIDRLEDFGRLFMFFARQELEELGDLDLLRPRSPVEDPWLPAPLMVRLLRFAWPGNVRQLRNVVRQLVIGCRGEKVLHMVPKLEEILQRGSAKKQGAGGRGKPAQPGDRADRKPRDIRGEELISALKNNRWDVKSTAGDLGISRAAVYLLIEKTPGLRKASDLSAQQIRSSLTENGGVIETCADQLRVSVRALRRRMTALGID